MGIGLWIGFFLLVILMLILDLGVFHRNSHIISIREAFAWTAFWILLAVLFNVGIYFIYENKWFGVSQLISGHQAVLEFFTGYLIEESLSFDNIFVIAMVFSFFRVPLKYQHRVLFWGILGAVVLRGLMIGLGTALIQRFEWFVYIFGGILLFTAIRMLIINQDDLDPERSFMMRMARRFFKISSKIEGPEFFTRVDGERAITPLFLVLLMVESMDLIFAVDSIPAIISVTREPFIIFTSNVFAILGLRSLYFALAAMIEKFKYIKVSLVFLLAFVGVKMLISHHFPISIEISLIMISSILSIGILSSLIATQKKEKTISPLGTNQEVKGVMALTYQGLRRILVTIVGMTVLLVGIAMIVLPGPAILVIPAGLAILATEFVWARRLLKKVKEKSRVISKEAGKIFNGGNTSQ